MMAVAPGMNPHLAEYSVCHPPKLLTLPVKVEVFT
jgi:hypothetical protein